MKTVDYLTRGQKELTIEIIVIWKKYGFFGEFFSGGCWFLGVKRRVERLSCGDWANQARKICQKMRENIQKRLKIFKNIQILSGNVQKYLKIFDIFRR
jgi:hypothetical protein